MGLKYAQASWASTGPTGPGTVTVLVSDNDPSLFGQPVMFTAFAAGPSGSVGLGDVVFSEVSGLGGFGGPYVVPLGTGGMAALTVSSLAPGNHVIGADFAATGGYSGSTAALGETVRFLGEFEVVTNGQYPNRVELRLGSAAGPLAQDGPLGPFDPRRDLRLYVDGQPLNISSFSYDPVCNRYLMFIDRAINLQGTVQAVHHLPSPPFASSGFTAPAPGSLLLESGDFLLLEGGGHLLLED